MRAAATRLLAALVLAGVSVVIQDDGAGVAIYGSEGGLAQVHPRLQGGWPATFLADDPATSVPCRLGVEDVFRLAPFIADVAFWFLAVGVAWRLARRITAR